MSSWHDELKMASRERTLSKARRTTGKGVHYILGKGGFDPSRKMTRTCDCSGFVAWAIGIPRELPPGSGNWLQTTTYWEGGGSAGAGLFDQIPENFAEPGDIIVYPDRGNKQGHMGIVSAVENGYVTKVIHCSSGNDRKFNDAIQETVPTVFRRIAKTRIMQVDYPALRDLFNLSEPEDGEEESVDIPVADNKLDHPLLVADETLKQVVRGLLILEATGQPVIGCRALHDGLNRLAKNNPRYRVELGPRNRWHGYYGNKTKQAIKNFQSDRNLPDTGETDAETLFHLDEALMALEGPPPAQQAAKPAKVSMSSEGSNWFAKIDLGSRFFVGRRVRYLGRFGLTNIYKRSGPVYRPQDYESEFDHWAWMLYPTTMAESEGYFNCINTYDRARFTFGFYQMAAHTPNSNFVVLLRHLLELESASYYFPDLSVENGQIFRVGGEDRVPLETPETTRELMNYLNPSGSEVEVLEVIQSAKFIHWATHEMEHQRVQVKVATKKLKDGMRSYARRYDLDGMLDSICLMVADIRHQGRAKSTEIIEALQTGGGDQRVLTQLLEIGAHSYAERIQTLKTQIRRLTQNGVLGRRRYNAQLNEFVL